VNDLGATGKYILTDVKLTGMKYVPTPQELQVGQAEGLFMKQYANSYREQNGVMPTTQQQQSAWNKMVSMGSKKNPPPFQYNSWTSLYDVISSSNHTSNFNLGLSNVISWFANVINITHLSSGLHNSQSTRYMTDNAGTSIKKFKKLRVSKSGVLYPWGYELNLDTLDNSPQPEVYRNAMDAIVPFMAAKYELPDLVNNLNNKQSNFRELTSNPLIENTDGGPFFAFGVNYDPISKNGINFKEDNLTIQI